jgi:hypothetical protein
VSLIAVTCGIPYYRPYLGRPFDRPVEGGGIPPEHPLAGIARWVRIAAAAQAAAPELRVIGGGGSWLRRFFPLVAAAMVGSGRASFFGSAALAYPDQPRPRGRRRPAPRLHRLL